MTCSFWFPQDTYNELTPAPWLRSRCVFHDRCHAIATHELEMSEFHRGHLGNESRQVLCEPCARKHYEFAHS